MTIKEIKLIIDIIFNTSFLVFMEYSLHVNLIKEFKISFNTFSFIYICN